MNYSKNRKNFTIFLMFIVILIDIMSYSIIFPVMPGLFFSHSGLLGVGTPLFYRNLFYGITLAIGPLGIFIGPPILGKLSDIIGRKKVIIYCLIINIVLYAVSGYLIIWHALILFIIVRFFIGLFAGNFAAAQTVILDLSNTEKDKMKNIGWISLAAYIALILGPAVSGFTVQMFSDLWTPFWVIAASQVFLFIFVLFFLRENFTPRAEKFSLSLSQLLASVFLVFRDKRIIYLSMIFLVFQFGFSHYMQGINVVMNRHFQLSTASLGYFWCIASIGGIIAQVVLQPIIIEKCDIGKVIKSVVVVMVFLAFATLFLNSIFQEYIVAFFFFMCELILYNAIVAKISSRVGKDEQGEVMGGITAIYGVTGAITAISVGLVLNIGLLAPEYIALIFMILLAILVFRPERKRV